jgi:type IV secretion system protein VirD4
MLETLEQARPPVKERGIYLGWGRSPETGQYTRIGYKGPKHLLGFGPSGAGKSLALCVPALATQRRSMVVIDPKGQLAAISARHRAKMGRVIVL